MLVKHGDIVFDGILFKKVTGEWRIHNNICKKCIFYAGWCCEFPYSLNYSCRSLDTAEDYYIPRGYVNKKDKDT